MPRTAAPDGGMASAAGLIPAPRESIASYAAARAGCVQRVAMPRPPGGGPPVVQRVRQELGESAVPITAAQLLALWQSYTDQIGELGVDPRDMDVGRMTSVEIARPAALVRARLAWLRALPADTTFTQAQIDDPQTEDAEKFKRVWKAMDQLREALNRPFEVRRLMEASQQRKGAAAAAAAASVSASKAAPSPGPKKKGTWAKVYPALGKLKPTNVFYQFVPPDAKTIGAALKSQSILDAVYHHDKAFWVANPHHYEVGTSHGKVRMEYTFDPKAAQSLVTDYLLCATEDIDGTNPEDYTGETGHPDYTLWKTNEPGAYGIGSRRLAQLAPYVKIRAFDASNREIVPGAEKKKEAASAATIAPPKGKGEPRRAAARHNAKAQEDAPVHKPAPLAASGSAAPVVADQLRVMAEPAVDAEVADTVRAALVEHQIDPGPILVVSGDRWTCYIRAVLQQIGRIRDYVYIVGKLESDRYNLGNGVEVGSETEMQILGVIEAMLGQQLRVTAFDAGTPNILHHTQPRAGQGPGARAGTEVRLIRTGVHFSLILAGGGGAQAAVAQNGAAAPAVQNGGGAAPAAQASNGGAAPGVNNNNGSAS